MNRKKIVKIRQ